MAGEGERVRSIAVEWEGPTIALLPPVKNEDPALLPPVKDENAALLRVKEEGPVANTKQKSVSSSLQPS